MWYPLHQQAARRVELVQQASNPAQISRRETIKFSMHKHAAGIYCFACFRTTRVASVICSGRTPDMDFITGSSESRRNQVRVVADAPRLRWILARDDVPFRQL